MPFLKFFYEPKPYGIRSGPTENTLAVKTPSDLFPSPPFSNPTHGGCEKNIVNYFTYYPYNTIKITLDIYKEI